MYERLTDRARKVMQLANQEAQRFSHEYIDTEHILLGLVKEGSGTAAHTLKNLDVDLRRIRVNVEKTLRPSEEMVTMGRLPQTLLAKKVVEFAMKEARTLGNNYVGTEHLLLGLMLEEKGVAAQVLMDLGLRFEDVREEVLNIQGQGGLDEDRAPYVARRSRRPFPRIWDVSSEDPLRFHPLILPIIEDIRSLDGKKEEAISNQDFELAATILEKVKQSQARIERIYKQLQQAGALIARDELVERLTLPVQMPPRVLIREEFAATVIEAMSHGHSVVLVGENGSGRRTLISQVATAFAASQLDANRPFAHTVQPNHLQLYQEFTADKSQGEVSRFVQEIAKQKMYALAVPSIEDCVCPDVLEPYRESWKSALSLAQESRIPLVASTTEVGLRQLKVSWPGLLESWQILRLQEPTADELRRVVEDRLLYHCLRYALAPVEGFLDELIDRSSQWNESVSFAQPLRTILFLDKVLENAVATKESVTEIDDHAKQLLARREELVRMLSTSLARHEFNGLTATAQKLESVDSMLKKHLGELAINAERGLSSKSIDAIISRND